MAAKDPRRKVEVERLLHWAYRQELSKAAILGWSYNALSQVWDYGTPIDGSRPGGSGTYYASVFEVENPHEDALLVHEAVCELDALRQDWHEQDVAGMLLADMPEEVQQAASSAIADYKVQRTPLVVTFSKIGSRPDWKRRTVPVRKPVTGPNGRPVWVVDREIKTAGTFGAVHSRWVEEPGYDARKKKPLPNARMKFEWEPPLRLLVDDRADYCHWHASLTWLAEELRSRLTAWFPTGPACAALPWVTGEASGPRVLPSLQRAA